MIYFNSLIFPLAIFLVGLAAGLLFFKTNFANRLERAERRAQEMLEKAAQEKESQLVMAQSKRARYQESILLHEQRFEQFSKRLEQSISFLEQKNQERESQKTILDQKAEIENNELKKLESEIDSLKKEVLPRLSARAGSSEEQIKKEILSLLSNDLEIIREIKLKKKEDYLKEESPQIARNYLTEAIQRFASPTSVEKKSLLIPISREDTLFKLMGKNMEIFAFIEEATGCDLIFENEKKGITVSHFQHVQRHIAREALIKMIKDRVIDLDKAKRRLLEATTETRALLIELGNKVVQKLDLTYRKFPDDFKEILGRLKYRTSYGQNILKHCFEVGYFTLILGNELGLKEEICKIGGFFHDLGKAIDQEDGRPHDLLTKEIMERFGIFSWEEIHAAWTHHDAVPIETAEALLVKAADAISAGRPGARQETIEKYLARISAIERIANSYEGVTKSYAISGGRELRVIIDHKELNDENLPELATTIAREIEGNVAYPGQIKVNVIRRIQYYRTAKEKRKLVAQLPDENAP